MTAVSKTPALLMQVAVTLLVLVPALVLINAHGTKDVTTWELWAHKIIQAGPRHGFFQIGRDYPPLASLLLAFSIKCGSLLGWDAHLAFKVSLMVAFWTTIGVFWKTTNNFWATTLAALALLLHGTSCGYLDTYYAPLLLGAIVAFVQRRYGAFSVLFMLSVMVKWEPVIMAPFFMLHVVREQGNHGSWRSGLRVLSRRVLFPAGILCTALVMVFGWKPLSHAMGAGFTAHAPWSLSNDALNMPWIISHLLEWMMPQRFGTLVNGEAQALKLNSEMAQHVWSLPFFGVYAMLLFLIWKAPQSTVNTLKACLLACMAHFILSPGLYAADLFPAVLLGLYLFAVGDQPWEIAVALALLMNANLLCFHGLDGKGLRYDRSLFGCVDVALGMAIIAVAVFLLMLAGFVRSMRSRQKLTMPLIQPTWLMRTVPMALLAALSILLVNAEGRPDIRFFWEEWSLKIMQYGPAEGYRQIWMDYPPLASQFLGFAAWCGSHLGINVVLSIKFSLLLTFWATLGVFWMATRHYGATLLTGVAMLLGSVAHAYLDIYYAPFFFGALAALSRGRYRFFAVLYALALLVKWQPIIVAPFLFLHILRTHAQYGSWKRAVLLVFREVALPMAAVGVVFLGIFGPTSLAHALALTFAGPMHKYWSVMGLNLPWCVSHLTELTYAGDFTGYMGRTVHMEGGKGTILPLPTDWVQPFTRLPFMLGYLFCLYSVWKNPVSVTRTLFGCVMGYTAYFALNTGVHENHLFPAMLIALFLFGKSWLSLEFVACLVLIMNANILVFNGLEGSNLRFDRALGGTVDVAFCMAILNVLVSCFIVLQLARRLRGGEGVQKSLLVSIPPTAIV